MGKYEQDARLLLEYVGGKENIAAVSHCVSRMRFVLNDPAKADVAKIEALKSAKGTFTQAGQFQVIIGNTVSDFYNDFIAVSGIDGVSKDAVKSAAKQNQNALQKVMSVLAEIFAPLIPAIITGGLILGFRNCIDSILTIDKDVSQVTYTYDCGFSRKAVFTLRVTETGSAPVDPPVTPPEPPVTPPTGGGDGGGAVVIVAAAGAVAAGVVGYGVYNYVSGRKLQALLPEGVAAPENRAQTALLLWNTAGRPEPADAPAFADVADPDTAKAAQWCVEQGLMKRRLNGKFAPGSSIPAYQVLNAYRKLAG